METDRDYNKCLYIVRVIVRTNETSMHLAYSVRGAAIGSSCAA